MFPAGALEVAAAEAVVCVVTAIGEAVLASIAFKLPFLIGDGVRFTLLFIVAGQSLIEGGDERPGVLKLFHGVLLPWG